MARGVENIAMRIFVRAKPNAKEPRVTALDGSHFEVAVKEPPRNGEANRAITRSLAEHFGVAPSHVRLISGFASREKVFELT